MKIRFVEKQPPTTWNIVGAQRIRLLLQRESERRSSALEPGDRTAHRRSFFTAQADADVQRLRRSGGEPLYRHGLEEKLLMISVPDKILRFGMKPVVFLACLGPVATLAWKILVTHDLGANPVDVITRSTGKWTLTFLLITLAVTPLRKLLGMPWLIRFRRMLGLFAFFYGSMHLMTYVWLDKFFDVQAMLHDIAKRKFITAGMTAWACMLPLAITSTTGWIRRLGGKRWQKLHRLIYLAPQPALCISSGWSKQTFDARSPTEPFLRFYSPIELPRGCSPIAVRLLPGSPRRSSTADVTQSDW